LILIIIRSTYIGAQGEMAVAQSALVLPFIVSVSTMVVQIIWNNILWNKSSKLNTGLILSLIIIILRCIFDLLMFMDLILGLGLVSSDSSFYPFFHFGF
jgi:hypothetical protein